MRKTFVLLMCLSMMPNSFAGISFQKPSEETKSLPVEKTAAEVKKAIVGDLSGVSARLRIEGASFRPFNLYLSPTTSPVKATAQQKNLISEIHQIIERDLKIVPGFNFVKHAGAVAQGDIYALMKQKGAEGVSKIDISFQGDNIKATIEHKNLITGKRTIKSFVKNTQSKRLLSHTLAQSIYEEFIGPENLFMSQIAAVKRDMSGSQIVLMDFDGQNETVLSQGPWRKASPYFSCDGKSILYTVITPQGQGIVEQQLTSKQVQFRTKKSGINLDPRVIPDNTGLLVTLSFENSANVYRTTRTGVIVGKLTNSLGLNLSPSISPDGKEFAFVSDRSGTPQIYVQPLGQPHENKPATRLTFQGKYNQTPHFSPDGKYIAFTGRDENFDIFLIERATGRMSRVTEKQGRNQEPHFSPSGRLVIFTSERDGKNKPDIFISSLNGENQVRLTDASSNNKSLGYFSPVIRPK